jgi:hypothetical protein
LALLFDGDGDGKIRVGTGTPEISQRYFWTFHGIIYSTAIKNDYINKYVKRNKIEYRTQQN